MSGTSQKYIFSILEEMVNQGKCLNDKKGLEISGASRILDYGAHSKKYRRAERSDAKHFFKLNFEIFFI